MATNAGAEGLIVAALLCTALRSIAHGLRSIAVAEGGTCRTGREVEQKD